MESYFTKGIFPLLIILLFSFAISRLSCGVRRYERAAERYEEILRHDPTDVKASFGCAEAYYQRALREETDSKIIESLDKAIECYRRAMALERKDLIPLTAYVHLGMAYFKKSLILGGDYFYHEAEVQLKEAILQDPSLREARLYLGHIYYHQGRKREALKEYRKAERLGLTDQVSIFNLACEYKESGRYEEAIELFKKAINTKGLNKENLLKARLALGWLYYNQKAFKKSINQYNEALKLEGSSVKAHYWLGRAYKASGDRETARQEWQEVLKIDPHNKDAKAQLAGMK